jgi:hypothetical protein
MRALAFLPLLLCSLAPAAALAAEPRDATPVERPLHLAPTWAELAAAYPRGAQGAGEAHLSCQLTPLGRYVGCVVTRETPPHEGFGVAGLSLMPSLQALEFEGSQNARAEITLFFSPPGRRGDSLSRRSSGLQRASFPDAVHLATQTRT